MSAGKKTEETAVQVSERGLAAAAHRYHAALADSKPARRAELCAVALGYAAARLSDRSGEVNGLEGAALVRAGQVLLEMMEQQLKETL